MTYRTTLSPSHVRDPARFWAKVDKGGPIHSTLGTACWLWTARIARNGYGQFWLGGTTRLAHRVSFMLAGREIPNGLGLDHLCRNRACVNPAHLEPVTNRENLARSTITLPTIQSARTHCPQGHAYAGGNLRVYRGSRYCRECRLAQSRAHRARKRAVWSLT